MAAALLITGAESLELAVEEYGLLPLFRNDAPGFSIEELTPAEYWFTDGVEGPWEWRMTVAGRHNSAYGKLFAGKAGFCSQEYYADLANYRRDGYDFDARWEDGLANYRDKQIIDALTRRGPLLTRELKNESGVDRGFESCLTRLQMQCYITVESFVYARDRHGRPYGWGLARYALSEDIFGELPRSAYSRPPAESKERLLQRLRGLCPDADEKALFRLIK